jgi:hypothetical protein
MTPLTPEQELQALKRAQERIREYHGAPLTPEQEAAVESACMAITQARHGFNMQTMQPVYCPVCAHLRSLVQRVTYPAGCGCLCHGLPEEEHLKRQDTVHLLSLHDDLRERISTLEGLLREAGACVEIVERRDMGGQEWLDARRLRLRIEAELAAITAELRGEE